VYLKNTAQDPKQIIKSALDLQNGTSNTGEMEMAGHFCLCGL